MSDLINSNTLTVTDVGSQPLQTASGAASSSPAQSAVEQVLVDFAEQVPPAQLCSENICASGHHWQPVLALSKCPGCGSQLLVVKMLNCPICNEPTCKFRLRTDHLPQGGQIMPMCRGSASLADVGQIEIERRHASETQAEYKEREMISKIYD